MIIATIYSHRNIKHEMKLSPILTNNLQLLSRHARQGYTDAGRGAAFVSFAKKQAQGNYFFTEAVFTDQFAEALVLLDLSLRAIEDHHPEHKFVLLALSEEGDELQCWIIEYSKAQHTIDGTR